MIFWCLFHELLDNYKHVCKMSDWPSYSYKHWAVVMSVAITGAQLQMRCAHSLGIWHSNL